MRALTKTILGAAGTLAAIVLFMPVNSAQAFGGSCRDYTKTSLLNGRVEVSFAQACRDYGDRWEIVDLRAPVEMRDYMYGMIHRDLYAMNPRYVIVNQPRNFYYSPAPQRVVVYQEPRTVYVNKYPKHYDNVHYYKHDKHHNHKHHKKHDHHRDHHHDRDRDRDHDRDDHRGHGMGSWR